MPKRLWPDKFSAHIRLTDSHFWLGRSVLSPIEDIQEHQANPAGALPLTAATDLINALETFRPGGQAEARAREAVLSLLRDTDAPFSRHQFDPGHVTASGLVLSPDRTQALLVLHRRLGVWLQPGGHVEDADATVEATARREVREETGIDVHTPGSLIGIDVHEIPADGTEPAHLHHDLCFLYLSADTEVEGNHESHDVQWWPRDRIGRAVSDTAVRRYATRAFNSTFPSM